MTQVPEMTFEKAAEALKQVVLHRHDEIFMCGGPGRDTEFAAAPHVSFGSYGSAPGLAAHEQGHPEFWQLIVRHPAQARGQEEYAALDKDDDRADYDVWEQEGEYLFFGDEAAALRDLTALMLSNFTVVDAAPER